jgi:hypothetical protein
MLHFGFVYASSQRPTRVVLLPQADNGDMSSSLQGCTLISHDKYPGSDRREETIPKGFRFNFNYIGTIRIPLQLASGDFMFRLILVPMYVRGRLVRKLEEMQE